MTTFAILTTYNAILAFYNFVLNFLLIHENP